MKQDIRTPSPPKMERSKVQLSTSYGPGSLFTFEGNLVACEAVPHSNYRRIEIATYSEEQIFSRIEEIISSWYRLASSCRDSSPDSPPIHPRMCIDQSLLRSDFSGLDVLRRTRLEFVEPSSMGYRPALLTMVCNRCKRVKTFDGVKDFWRNRNILNQTSCDSGGRCEWRQMDVVFVHPIGNVRQALPGRFDWNSQKETVTYYVQECKKCGSREVKINDKTSQISKRHFLCAQCGAKRETQWVQNEKEMLEIFGESSRDRLHDVRMRPVSYRANSVYYVKSDVVIDFGKNENLRYLSSGREQDFRLFIAKQFDFPITDPPEAEIEKEVKKLNDGELKWNEYVSQKNALKAIEQLLDGLPDEKRKEPLRPGMEAIREKIDSIIESWRDDGVITAGADLPAELVNKLNARNTIYDSRYDPFRLLVEHKALTETYINDASTPDGKRIFVSLNNLDEYIGPDDEEEKKRLNNDHKNRMSYLGVADIGLVRNLKLIHFSFGYSRISATPFTDHIGHTMPVRLKLFPKTTIDDDSKHPIYVIQQDNEAIYVKLQEEQVRKWLEFLNTRESLRADKPVGATIVEEFYPMSTYLDNIPGKGSITERPYLALSVLTLLHTFAHHIMNAIADLSGLDISSMGEYLFPVDLALIVYRKGATTDLGNLSSMLRNNAPAFLDYLLDNHNLGCGAGSLCSSRGGACPDCIMIPEVSCVAQNKLLSRSVLIGGDYPHEGSFYENIPGYFSVAQDTV